MSDQTFDTPMLLSGPFRAPKQMLATQEYDGHVSIHDDAMAEKLGSLHRYEIARSVRAELDQLAEHLERTALATTARKSRKEKADGAADSDPRPDSVDRNAAGFVKADRETS